MVERYYDLESRPISQGQWAKIFRSGKGRLRKSQIFGYEISTAWTGLNFFDEGETPLPFETMVFRAGTFEDVFCEKYETRQEALDNHDTIVERARNGEFDEKSE